MSLYRYAILLLSVPSLACSGSAEIDAGAGGGSAGGGGAGQGGTPSDCLCEAPPLPVCGVDGNTYNAACGDECVPVAIDCQNECPCGSCGVLESEYAALLSDARACDPALDIDQCTTTIPNALACGCPTPVNPSNAEAVAALAALSAEWQERGCYQDAICPAVECDTLVGTVCTPTTGASGQCEGIVDSP